MTPAAASLTVLASIILFFCIAFERSRPSAGDIVVVAQLTALCSAARLIFSFVPYYNPVVAIIFLSGIALGVRKGFVIGAMTALVSNVFLGQGPWTVYQMVSWGMAGVFAGLLSELKAVRKSQWKMKDYAVCIAVSSIIIVFLTGPLMDLSSCFLYDYALKLALTGGFIFNVTLAVSTAVTIVLIAQSFLFIVERTRWAKSVIKTS